uniref:REJ domain-containing protein n=1 Tax=Macrostomum lignano TaxID=282301 RepID=A0A1I8IMI5_9PLAT
PATKPWQPLERPAEIPLSHHVTPQSPAQQAAGMIPIPSGENLAHHDSGCRWGRDHRLSKCNYRLQSRFCHHKTRTVSLSSLFLLDGFLGTAADASTAAKIPQLQSKRRLLNHGCRIAQSLGRSLLTLGHDHLRPRLPGRFRFGRHRALQHDWQADILDLHPLHLDAPRNTTASTATVTESFVSTSCGGTSNVTSVTTRRQKIKENGKAMAIRSRLNTNRHREQRLSPLLSSCDGSPMGADTEAAMAAASAFNGPRGSATRLATWWAWSRLATGRLLPSLPALAVVDALESRPQSAAATDSSSGVNQTSKPPPPPASRTVSARSYADRGRSATAVQHLTIMPNRQYSPEQLENRMKWRDDPSEIVSVTINQSGFSKTSVNIVTGNFVAFSWNIADSEAAAATEPSLGCNVTQVVHDGEQFRPVPGGIHSGQLTARGNFSHRFGIVGEFTFVCAGIRCQPLTVRVSERPPFQIEFAADRGFSVESADLEAGESVKWLWRDLPAEMRVLPAELCINCGLRQSDGSGSEREHRVRIRDDGFDPPITFISVGDRVWFEWGGGGSDICQFRHAPFEISADRSGPEFKPTQAAYRWQRASRCGLMAHDFLRIIKPDATCYVSHFADLSAATVGKLRRRSGKLGSIVVSVRPAQVEVRVDEAGRFQPDFLSLSVGDSVLLELQGEANKRLTDLKLVGGTALSNDEVENWRKLGNSGDDGESFGCSDCKQLKPATAKQLPQVSAIFLNSKCCSTPMGVRHFRWHGNDDNVLSVISRPGCQTRTVRLTDSGSFEPSEIFVQPGDSLLCSWQTGRRTLQFADTIGEVDESSTDTDSQQQKLGQSIDGPCVLSFHLPELSDRSDAASDNRVHRSRFDLTSDSGSQLRVHRRSTAGQRQIRLMDLTTKSVSRTTVLAQLGDLAVWMFNSPDDAVKAVQSLNAKSLDVKSRIVEQCLDSPGPVTVSNVSLFVAQDADRSMQELDFDATVGMSVSTGKVRPSLVTVPRGGCVLISLTGSINSEQPNSELHKIDNDGKKSANKQNNEDGVKIDKINPKKFRCIFNRCGIYRFAIMTESGSTGGGLACVIVLWRPELTPKPQLDWSAGKPQFRCSRAEDAGEPVDVYFTTDGSCPWPHRESLFE